MTDPTQPAARGTFFRGLDLDVYPGDQVMAALRASFDFCGFYLQAPSHPDHSWRGKRDVLVAQGWGLAAIFVGQQSVGPGGHNLSAGQGRADGVAACAVMAAEGFPKWSTVFVDLENGPPFGQAEAEYLAALLAAIREGGYGDGVYCSHLIAEAVRAVAPLAAIWAFNVPTVERTEAAPPFARLDPAGSGFAYADLWQYRQNTELAVGKLRLLIDLDTATTADPSAP